MLPLDVLFYRVFPERYFVCVCEADFHACGHSAALFPPACSIVLGDVVKWDGVVANEVPEQRGSTSSDQCSRGR